MHNPITDNDENINFELHCQPVEISIEKDETMSKVVMSLNSQLHTKDQQYALIEMRKDTKGHIKYSRVSLTDKLYNYVSNARAVDSTNCILAYPVRSPLSLLIFRFLKSRTVPYLSSWSIPTSQPPLATELFPFLRPWVSLCSSWPLLVRPSSPSVPRLWRAFTTF